MDRWHASGESARAHGVQSRRAPAGVAGSAGAGASAGSSLGLSVYALVPLPAEPARSDEDMTVLCGRFGADKVLLLTGDRLFQEQEMRYSPMLTR